MSKTLEGIRHQIAGAKDLLSVVRTMKVLAASNMVQYEKAFLALKDFSRTIALGLSVCLQRTGEREESPPTKENQQCLTGVVVFGSDQGLVGQFNDVLSDYVARTIKHFKSELKIWAVGERIKDQLLDRKLPVVGTFAVPGSINTITATVNQILLETQLIWKKEIRGQVYIFHNQPKAGVFYEPSRMKLLPLDNHWQNKFAQIMWPNRKIPEAINSPQVILHSLIRTFLFVSLYRICTESLVSENASRLASMQRAEKNIDDLLNDLTHEYNQFRQSSIDEELFDLISGSEALINKNGR